MRPIIETICLLLYNHSVKDNDDPLREWEKNREKTMKQKVYDFLLTIPKGKVATYGQIAEYLGNKKLARVIGNILHNNPDEDKYPCYKVVNSKGDLSKQFAFGGIEKQKEKLEKDGITVINYKVNLAEYKML